MMVLHPHFYQWRKPVNFKTFPSRIKLTPSISHCFHLQAAIINLCRFGEKEWSYWIELFSNNIWKQGDFHMVLDFVMPVSFCWQTEVIWNTDWHLWTSLSKSLYLQCSSAGMRTLPFYLCLWLLTELGSLLSFLLHMEWSFNQKKETACKDNIIKS